VTPINPRLNSQSLCAVLSYLGCTGARARTRAASIPSRCRHWPIPTIPSSRQRSCSGRRSCRRRCARVIGFYAKGCIAGAKRCDSMAETWQVMRLSANRNWAHPNMVALLERLAAKAHKDACWPGYWSATCRSQRGGPCSRGHASHQVDCDPNLADACEPAVCRATSHEDKSAVMMVSFRPARHRSQRLDAKPSRVNPCRPQEPSVQRIFVNAAIKKALCREARRSQLALKVRTMYGQRLSFPYPHQMSAAGSELREASPSRRKARLQHERSRLWFKDSCASEAAEKPPKPKPPMTLAPCRPLPREFWRRRTQSKIAKLK